MFSHSSGVVADLSDGAQESVMVEGGASIQDIQQEVQARREKAAENLTKVRRAMKQCFYKCVRSQPNTRWATWCCGEIIAPDLVNKA